MEVSIHVQLLSSGEQIKGRKKRRKSRRLSHNRGRKFTNPSGVGKGVINHAMLNGKIAASLKKQHKGEVFQGRGAI